jgi:3-oxoacyl-[acyl-carrier-protein] synthase II
MADPRCGGRAGRRMNRAATWITGVGICTPCGNDVDAVAAALLNGRSAVRTVARFDASQHASQIAASVDAIPLLDGFDASDLDGCVPAERLTIFCAGQALRSAGLWEQRGQLRIGLAVGVGTEWLVNWESDGLGQFKDRPTSGVEVTRRVLGLSGPAVTVSAACASGNHAIALARSWLRQGLVDVCLAGGCDMAVTPLTLASFGNLRALSRRNDAPTVACRPFDKGRDGFVLGEGGVICVMETADAARRRGVNGLAEVAGFGATSDAHHLVIPSPDPAPAAKAIRQALADAEMNVGDIDYVNAHGTGTPVGDVMEAAALATVFGEVINTVPVSSTKSVSGHLLTAAAAFEAVAGIIAMDRRAIPPTINLDDPDPACPLNHVAHTAREAKVKSVLSNSFGFGGSNTALVLRNVA